MSHSLTDRLRRRLHSDDEGFGLIEIMISMLIFGIVIVSTAPLLVGGLKAGRISQLNLQGKALGQERVELMRNLPYHVARQNGQYLDVLDIYFRDIAATGTLAANDTCDVRNYSSATKTYTCRINDLGADYPGFFQTIATQFLDYNRNVITPPAGYTSQTDGADSPVSALLGVVVTTSWPQSGTTKSYAIRSQIANGQANASLLRADLSVSAINIASNLADGDLLQLEAGSLASSGTLTTGSTARLTTATARAEKASGSGVRGAGFSISAPPVAAGGSPSEPSGQPLDGSCDLACFGATEVTGNQAVTVASGQPQASLSSDPVRSTLRRSGSGLYRGFTYNNALSASVDPALQLNGPMVSAGLVGVSDVAVGSGYLDATGTGATAVRASGSVILPALQLFPTSFAPLGVVQVSLDSGSLNCSSGGGAGAAATASWTGTVRYWTDFKPTAVPGVFVPGYVTLALGVDALPDPTTIEVRSGQLLSTWVQAWTGLTSSASVSESSGVQSKGTVPAILSLLTAETRLNAVTGAADPTSAINIAVGSLSCLAEDNR